MYVTRGRYVSVAADKDTDVSLPMDDGPTASRPGHTGNGPTGNGHTGHAGDGPRVSTRRGIVISSDECRRLLAQDVIGHLAVVIGRTPTILPVNYAVDGEDIVMRSQSGSRLDIGRGRATFEIDHFDRDRDIGWSVLVAGQLEEVNGDHPELRQRIQALPIAPWPAGGHDPWLLLRPGFVTGRIVRGDTDRRAPAGPAAIVGSLDAQL